MNLGAGILLAAFFMGSCTSPQEKSEPPKIGKDSVTAIEVPSTDMVFSFDQEKIPNGFALDTLFYEDTIKRVSFTVYYFKGMGDSLQDYNTCIQAALMAHFNRMLTFYDLPLEEFQTSTDEYGPQQVVANKKWINTQFISDSYTDGGNHHNYGWFSLNYNREKKKMVWFSHEFQLRTQKDSLDFRALVGRHLEKDRQDLSGCCNDSVDFFVRGNDLVFGPYLSWAEGLQTSTLPLDSLVKFLNRKGALRPKQRSN